MFVEKLRRKAENAGGKVEDINTYRTKLSQACHCGKNKKASSGMKKMKKSNQKFYQGLFILGHLIRKNIFVSIKNMAQTKPSWVFWVF